MKPHRLASKRLRLRLRLRPRSRLIALATASFLGAAMLPAGAATVAVGSSAELAANASLDWASLGADGTLLNPIVFVGSASSGNTVFGSSLQLAPPGLELRTQGGSWAGNFDPGQRLLYTGDGGQGPLSFSFLSPVQAVGTQVQRSQLGGFTAQIRAFDALGQPLQSQPFDFQFSGFSAVNQGAGPAVFIGLRSDAADIAKVQIELLPAPGADRSFAINALRLVDPLATPVPEPAAAWTLLAGLLGLGLRRRRAERR